MSKILIIGGAGLLGMHLAPVLSKSGHEVALCDNFSGSLRYRTPTEYRIFVANAMDANAMQHPVGVFQPDIVILGVEHYFSRDVVYKFSEESKLVLDSANVLCSVLGRKVKHVYFCSTSEVYGGPQTSRPLAETRKISRSATHYGTAKLAAEKLLEYRCKELGIGFTALRIFDMYGPRIRFSRRAAVVSFLIESLLRNDPIGLSGARCLRDFIHVEDVVSAFVGIIKSDFSGTVNIGTGKGMSLKTLAEELGKHINILEKIQEQPRFPLRHFSTVAKTSLLDSLLPNGWKPQHSLKDDLPALVEFREKELNFAATADPKTVLNIMRGVKGA